MAGKRSIFMRVITGSKKGRKLFSFPNEKPGLRPTSGHIKESVFNIIQFDIEGRYVLDLFAGTGQLGIEALSRGAKFADFVDNDISVVKKNLETTGFSDCASVRKMDAIAFLRGYEGRASAHYDLIFLDPPYDSPLLNKALGFIFEIDILRTGGIIVCEGSFEPDDIVGYKKSVYKYSGKVITIYTKE
jgi:16S rRNA (guanine(966)-N(2))-methyltransferase RsmD